MKTKPAAKAVKHPKSKKPLPLIIIGGTVLILAVAFYIISRVVLDQRDPEARRALSEMAERRDGGRDDDGVQREAKGQFRDDASLSFFASDGTPRVRISVEIAENEVSRTQGLMGRQQMAELQGMLFIFPNEQYRSFWMVNTPLSLDIMYVNKEKEIVTIQRNTVPFSEESIPSTRPATYVIEVNAGFADRHGITEGDKVQWLRR
ncbi:MAG: DUF192 domain-containing protein [Bacteroidetes bacterium]|nr:DUF192 domain-containing protein [Bacteroidota bacterium]